MSLNENAVAPPKTSWGATTDKMEQLGLLLSKMGVSDSEIADVIKELNKYYKGGKA